MSLLFTLPTEIIADILVLVVGSSNTEDVPKTRLRISLVCRRLHEIAMDTPAFWCHVSFPTTLSSFTGRSLAIAYAEKSIARVVRYPIQFELPHWSSEDMLLMRAGLTKLIVDYDLMDHCGSLTIHGCAHFLAEILFKPWSGLLSLDIEFCLGSLAELDIPPPCRAWRQDSTAAILDGKTESLRHVYLRHMTFEWKHIPHFTNLTTLYLSFRDFETDEATLPFSFCASLLNTLRSCPQLRLLHLDNMELNPDVRTSQAAVSEEIVPLPSLQNLTLSGGTMYTAHHWLHLLKLGPDCRLQYMPNYERFFSQDSLLGPVVPLLANIRLFSCSGSDTLVRTVRYFEQYGEDESIDRPPSRDDITMDIITFIWQMPLLEELVLESLRLQDTFFELFHASFYIDDTDIAVSLKRIQIKNCGTLSGYDLLEFVRRRCWAQIPGLATLESVIMDGSLVTEFHRTRIHEAMSFQPDSPEAAAWRERHEECMV